MGPPILSEDADDVQVAASEIFKLAGVGAYHTSIIIGDREYYFDSQGIESAPPFWSHTVTSDVDMQQLSIEVRNYGKSALTGRALLKGLAPFFEEGTYDAIFKNCNSWTDCALYFLTRRRLDPHFSRIERLLAATTPVSTGVIRNMMRAAAMSANLSSGSRGLHWEYTTNPLAKGFSLEAVIAACDALDWEATRPVIQHHGWGSATCCTRLCIETENLPVVVIPAVLNNLPLQVPINSREATGEGELCADPELETFVAVGSSLVMLPLNRPQATTGEEEAPVALEPPGEPAPLRRPKPVGQRRQLPI